MIYYIDSAGDDAKDGKTEATAWKTLGKVKAALIDTQSLKPDDEIRFKRGGTYGYVKIEVRNNGTVGHPITFSDYGSGALPIITHPAVTPGSTILKLLGNYITVENLRFSASPLTAVWSLGNNCIIQNCEMDGMTWGIYAYGNNGYVHNNYIHDGYKNSPNPPVGIMVSSGSNIEICHNTIARCRSMGSGIFDGCGIEFFGAMRGAWVHHNRVDDCQTFLETGGSSSSQIISDCIIEYNLVTANGSGFWINVNSGWPISYNNMIIRNNTIIYDIRSPYHYSWWYQIYFDELPPSDVNNFTFTNNIFSMKAAGKFANTNSFGHTHNQYRFGNDTIPGLTLHTTEQQGNPLFVNEAEGDFHLLPDSPCPSWGAFPRTLEGAIMSAIQDLRNEAVSLITEANTLDAEAGSLITEANALDAKAADIKAAAQLLRDRAARVDAIADSLATADALADKVAADAGTLAGKL